MAELLECLICGFQTVRCGMTNHLKAAHPKEYKRSMFQDELVKSLGQVKKATVQNPQKYGTHLERNPCKYLNDCKQADPKSYSCNHSGRSSFEGYYCKEAKRRSIGT